MSRHPPNPRRPERLLPHFSDDLGNSDVEILLTRILSVTIGYNLAFVAISLAMFGMTIDALKAYRNPAMFAAVNAKQQMSGMALWLAVAVLACLAFQFIVLPRLLNAFVSQSAAIRIAISAGTLAATGFFMGLTLAVGMRLSNRRLFVAGSLGN